MSSFDLFDLIFRIVDVLYCTSKAIFRLFQFGGKPFVIVGNISNNGLIIYFLTILVMIYNHTLYFVVFYGISREVICLVIALFLSWEYCRFLCDERVATYRAVAYYFVSTSVVDTHVVVIFTTSHSYKS